VALAFLYWIKQVLPVEEVLASGRKPEVVIGRAPAFYSGFPAAFLLAFLGGR
jgi:hypothetical protein